MSLTRTRQVLAVDPGGTTGVAHWAEAVRKPASAQYRDRTALLEMAHALAGELGPDLVIVCERFTIGAASRGKTAQPDALEIIGALRWIAHTNGATFAKLQSPADAKRLITNDALKKLGWYVVGQDHARDALRHLGLYLISAKMLDPSRLL